ncbi:MAG: PucR family transcriptional regulator ligand-binding domain-containing protein [Clostridia bacterium]|nr:PucR family transcriptional regulator ligand-binding domain-containing protein [Clostridia bacterium]
MAITVNKLYKNGISPYHFSIVAGNKGLSNFVTWVHVVEDSMASKFIRGGEIVITTGIARLSEEELLQFTKDLYSNGASAFVINTGEYIKSIPQSIIDYCNFVNMPLFTIPWQVKLVDVTRDFCNKIIQEEVIENTITSTMKNILFDVGDKTSNIHQMERYGYKKDCHMRFVCLNIPNLNDGRFDEKMEFLTRCAEHTAKEIQDQYIKFKYNSMLIIILTEYTENFTELFINNFISYCHINQALKNIHIGVSSNTKGLLNQKDNMNKAIEACKLATKQNKEIMYYDKMKEYKILLAVKDIDILKEYYNEILGKIEEYDRNNSTELLEFLEVYIKNNCSVQKVSEALYIHRNTVNNQLKKIEKITDCNMSDIETKTKCCLAFYIRDILK